MTAPTNFIRLIPREPSALDTLTYLPGSVFFDRDSATLRIYDGTTIGGVKLATEEFVQNNQVSDVIFNRSVIPTEPNTFDLGSSDFPWRSLYVSENTIFIGGVAVGVTDGQLTVGSDSQTVNLATETYVNSRGFITASALTWTNVTGKPTFSDVATSGNYNDLSNRPVLFSGNYNDLSNRPSIPSSTSQLTNDSGFVTSSDISTQVQVDWSQTNSAAVDFIRNKPTGLATESYVDQSVASLVASAPETLDTLNELAAALGNDPNFATTVANEIGTKAPINNPTFTGTVTIPSGASISGYASESYVDNALLVEGERVFTTGVDYNSVDFSGTNLVGFNSINEQSYADIKLIEIGSDITILFSGGQNPVTRQVTSIDTDDFALGYFTIGFTGGVIFGTIAGFSVPKLVTVSNALASKAPINNPTFTGTVSGITASMVGLGNVTNESKATMFTSPTFTGDRLVINTVQPNDNNGDSVSAAPVSITPTAWANNYDAIRLSPVRGDINLEVAPGSGRIELNGNVIWSYSNATFNIFGYGQINFDSSVSTFRGTMKKFSLSDIEFTNTSEVTVPLTSATGTVTHNFNSGSIFVHSSISGNFVANFTNVPTVTNRAISVVLVLNQGATARSVTGLQIAGAAQTIRWQDATAPTFTPNQTDIVSFTLLRSGSSWTVLGSLSTHG